MGIKTTTMTMTTTTAHHPRTTYSSKKVDLSPTVHVIPYIKFAPDAGDLPGTLYVEPAEWHGNRRDTVKIVVDNAIVVLINGGVTGTSNPYARSEEDEKLLLDLARSLPRDYSGEFFRQYPRNRFSLPSDD